MARTNLKVLSVYLEEGDHKTVSDAAAREARTMSNYAGQVVTLAAREDMAVTDLEYAIEAWKDQRKKKSR